MILQRCLASIVEGWMVRAKQSKELSWLSPGGDDSALDTSPKPLEDLVSA